MTIQRIRKKGKKWIVVSKFKLEGKKLVEIPTTKGKENKDERKS